MPLRLSLLAVTCHLWGLQRSLGFTKIFGDGRWPAVLRMILEVLTTWKSCCLMDDCAFDDDMLNMLLFEADDVNMLNMLLFEADIDMLNMLHFQADTLER
jgi:hypothetical protein